MFFKKKTVPAELVSLELPYFDRGNKKVRIFVPEHKKGEKLPVIYMTDGQSVFDEESNPLGCWHTREAVATEKAASGKSAIIVGIHSDPNPMFRTAELTPASIGRFVPPPMPDNMPPQMPPQMSIQADSLSLSMPPSFQDYELYELLSRENTLLRQRKIAFILSLAGTGTVVLGGDGTFLHASKALLTKNSAVLGINLGNLGFLTTAEYHDAEEALEKVVRDEYRELYASPLDIDWDERHIEAVAMNEVVVSRNGFSRLIHLQVLVNGEIVSDYQSDGVIISTPIGSTGYSLSAGGPIVQPHAAILLITPICPHTMKARPLAVSDSDVITVCVLRGSRSIPGEAVVSADGDEIGLLDVGQEITIRKGKAFARIISVGKVTFWDRVKSKL